MQKQTAKMKSTRKNWIRRTWTEKVNPEKKSTVKVNSLVNDDVSKCVADDVMDAW